ncbi:hypothetical protein [Amycolatopsis anabasis]|uniref:hypothetical protein n=1 Tax=Amycolatopsis anabasis TaxID=1840409 RepID=UPI001FEC2D47|nr:hypothetical protein [Amycolatopsis anabasis]
MEPVIVPGGMRETFVDCKGREHVVFRVPYPSEGPVLVAARSGERALVYMYAHFVFTWVEGMTQVNIAHGTIQGNRMRLWDGIPIRGRWDSETLAGFGQRWVREHLAKFG